MAGYWEIAAYSAYDMLSKNKYIIVNIVFSSAEPLGSQGELIGWP